MHVIYQYNIMSSTTIRNRQCNYRLNYLSLRNNDYAFIAVYMRPHQTAYNMLVFIFNRARSLK